MIGNKKWFVELDESFRHTVRLGNNSIMFVLGKGSVRFEVEGITQIVNDVYFVPNLTNKLLRIGQLQEKCMVILIKESTCKISDDKLDVETEVSNAIVTLPTHAKKIGVKWVYKTKLNEEGKVDKYKAQLVAKGYTQIDGIDYNGVYALVARWDTFRILLAMTAQEGWNVYQLDVKNAFCWSKVAVPTFQLSMAQIWSQTRCSFL
uniref:Copia protein n=1 Tax=Cajanus cajan TaxID=3821 RepID=A0A151SVR9_CAJCA|nr:Copia protein [Cajanus cajan]